MRRIDETITRILKEATGTEVYPVIANDDAKNPLIVYAEESFSTVYSKQGLEQFESVYTVDIFSSDYDKASEIEAAATEALKDYSDENISYCRLMSGSSTYGECYVKTLKFDIRHI
jgi:hypothetical protein